MMLPTDTEPTELQLEVTGLYAGVMRALAGATPAATQGALAMAMLMAGEYAGLEGQELVDWIAETGLRAAAGVGPAGVGLTSNLSHH